MTLDGVREAKRSCRVIYANYGIEADGVQVVRLRGPLDLVQVENGLVLLDEAGLWLPSFIWRKIPESLIWKLAQIRKDGLDLFYTAQNAARVVKVLREITYESVMCWKFFGVRVQKVYTGCLDDFVCYSFGVFRPGVWKMYDTLEKVAVLGG